MPILTLQDGAWDYTANVERILRGRFIMNIQRDIRRTTQPRVRAYVPSYGVYRRGGFEGRVSPQPPTGVSEQEARTYGFFEYELLKDTNEGFFEVVSHTPVPGTYFISIKKQGVGYEVLEYMNSDACIRAFIKTARHGDVKRIFGDSPTSFEDRRELGRPGPRDRYERLLDFGVKGVDPEPPLEEILEAVVLAVPRVRKEIPEEDLLSVLDQVETPPKDPFDVDEFLKNL